MSVVVDDALQGLVGEVVTRVRGPVDPGEVRVLYRGAFETFLAYGDEPIARGSSVLVLASRGAGSVDVIAWSVSALPQPGALGPASQDEE